MLEVTLELRCHVCSGDRFAIPTLDEPGNDVRCAECQAFKCHAGDLERLMMAASAARLAASRGAPRLDAR